MFIDRNSFAAALACTRGFAVISADTAIIPLGHKGKRRDGSTGLTGEFALVSIEDRELGRRYHWSKTRYGYARRRNPDGNVSWHLHREVMGAEPNDGLVIDHINRDRLDCRRSNLRFVTSAQNAQNRVAGGRTSVHRGVSLRSKDGKWVVNHKLNGVQVYSGAFDDEEEAARVARAWRAEHMTHAHD